MEPWHPAIEDAYQLLRGEKLASYGYDSYEIESLKDEEHPLEPYACTEKRAILLFNPVDGSLSGPGYRRKRAASPVSFSGRLIGGCLDILANLCGTKYDHTQAFLERYADDGFLWFLEACDLSVFGIRRAVWELQQAGWFRHVKGFLIGRPDAGREELMGLDHIHAVTDILASCDVPILLDTDIGHLPPMMPLISGCLASVTADGKGGMHLEMSLT